MAETYYESSLTGEQIEQVLENPVLTTSQSLTESQKTNARNNIGAYSKGATGIPLSDLSTDIVNRLVPIASGEDGQMLIKSNMFGSAWTSYYVQSVDGKTGQAHILPLGGTTGQVLKKLSDSNYDVIWANESGGSSYTDAIYYGVCSSAWSAQAKEVTISGVSAYANGLSLRILFANSSYPSSSGSMTLNVNSIGAKEIAGNNVGWQSGSVVDFVYNDNYWHVVDSALATTTEYGKVILASNSMESGNGLAVGAAGLRNYDVGVVTGLQAYSASSTYNVGDRVRVNNSICECNTAISTPEAWNWNHWTTLKPALKLTSVYVRTITLSATWSGSDPYTQTVTLPGNNSITGNTKVDIQPDATVIAQMIDDGVKALYIENNNGTLTAYAIGAAPTVSLSVQVTYYETTQGSST